MSFKHEDFLNKHLNHGVMIVYRNGFKLYGILRGVDQYSVLIDTGIQTHVIFKHEIAEIVVDNRKAKRERELREQELKELLS